MHEGVGHWPGVRSLRSLLFLKRGLLPKDITPAFGQCPRKIRPGLPTARLQPPLPTCLVPCCHSRSSFLLSVSLARGQIILLEAREALGEQQVAIHRERCRGGLAALRSCLCQQRPRGWAWVMNFPPPVAQSRPRPFWA